MAGRLEIDHFFVFVEADGDATGQLAQAGLQRNYGRAHPGQGTANACYCFDNAYLELLWVEASAELEAPALARTGLAERARWRRNGSCPFGIALRGGGTMPFETWDYEAPFLPDGMTIPVALSSDDPHQVFLFRSPGDAGPKDWTNGLAGERQRDAGLAEIVSAILEIPAGTSPCNDLQALEQAGLVTLKSGAPAWRMVLSLSRSHGGGPATLTLPDLTLG